MIITLKGANFTNANIGTLSDWKVVCSIGTGGVYNGVETVARGEAFSASIALDDGYEVLKSNISVTMGGKTLGNVYTMAGNIVAISIPEVTGNITINVKPTLIKYTLTINTTPAEAIVTMNGMVGNSLSFDMGTEITWNVSANGYYSKAGTHVITGDAELTVTLIDDSYINLYNAADYGVTRCYYGNSPSVDSTNTKVLLPQRNSTTASYGMDIQQFPVEYGKTYSIKLYNAPTTATTVGGTQDPATVPYFGFYGLMFFETIDGKQSVRYCHTTSNSTAQFAYWNTSKQPTYTGDIPISATNDNTQFAVTKTYNPDKINIINLNTGEKNSDSNSCIFGTRENKY